MSTKNLLRALPTELRGAYEKSSRGMAPTVLRLAFGLTNAMADDEGAADFSPATATGQRAKLLAESAMRAWEGIHHTHWSSMADGTTDKRAAFLRSAQHAKGVLKRIDGEFEALMREFDGKTAHLATVLGNASKAPTSVGDAMIDSELRAAIRAESNPVKAMELARTNPRAIATMPPAQAALLVGADGYRQLADTYLRSVAPDAVAERDEVMRAMDVATTAATELERRTNEMIDFAAANEMAQFAGWTPTNSEAA